MSVVRLSNGVLMPLVGFGTAGLKGNVCIQMVKQALQSGYRLIDTAQMYQNEKEVGQALKHSGLARSDIFLTTKIDRNSNSYAKAKKTIELSLQRLGTPYVDLLLLHEPYPQGPEMYRAIEEAYHEGKARAIGISNYNEDRYRSFLSQCKIVPMVNQLETHIYFQRVTFQAEMAKHGTCLQAWSPLAQAKANIATHPLLEEIGRHYKKTAAQVALRFLVQRDISVIPKTSHQERLLENHALFDFELSQQDMAAIEALDQAHTFFPWTLEF